MITPKRTDTKVVFGPCRLSYCHLFSKYVPEGAANEAGKYAATILIPKTETETVAALNAAIEAAKRNAVSATWKGKEPKNLDICLRDGDEKEGDTPEFDGCWYINAKSKTRPNIVDRNLTPITDEEEIYSGVWAIVSIGFYGYDQNGARGIAAGLNNVMKFKDDTPFGGRVSAETDFAGIDIPSWGDFPGLDDDL